MVDLIWWWGGGGASQLPFISGTNKYSRQPLLYLNLFFIIFPKTPDYFDLISSVQLLSHVWLFVTPWTEAHQASLFTISHSLLKLMSIESVIPSSHLPVIPFSSCLHSCPASGSFLMSQLFSSGGQSSGASASAWVLPMNIQDWFPLGLTGLISSQSKGLSRVFSNTTV